VSKAIPTTFESNVPDPERPHGLEDLQAIDDHPLLAGQHEDGVTHRSYYAQPFGIDSVLVNLETAALQTLAVVPPSTTNSAPVMNDALSERRNRHAFA